MEYILQMRRLNMIWLHLSTWLIQVIHLLNRICLCVWLMTIGLKSFWSLLIHNFLLKQEPQRNDRCGFCFYPWLQFSPWGTGRPEVIALPPILTRQDLLWSFLFPLLLCRFRVLEYCPACSYAVLDSLVLERHIISLGEKDSLVNSDLFFRRPTWTLIYKPS